MNIHHTGLLMINAYRIRSFVFLLFISIAAALQSQEKPLNFFGLSRVNGLSNNNVTAIVKDHQGYLWFGTENGLNRYNGYTFTNYYSSDNDSTSLPGNYISSLQTDQDGRLWVGCLSDGLAMYDRLTDSFITCNLSDKSDGSGSPDVYDIVLDKQNNLWVASDEGLFIYNKESESFESIPVAEQDYSNQNNDSGGLFTVKKSIPSICADEDAGIWAAYPDWQISYLDPANGTCLHYTDPAFLKINRQGSVNSMIHYAGKLYLATDNQGVIVSDVINGESNELLPDNVLGTATSLAEHEGTIWITSWNGVMSYDEKTGELHHYITDPSNPKSLTSGSTNALFIDDMGILWLGAVNKGINYAMIYMPFGNIHESEDDSTKLFHPNVSSLFYDRRGDLWIAFQSGIIQRYNKGERNRQIVPVDDLVPDAGIGHVFSFLESSSDSIYISSWQGGLQVLDRQKDRFVNIVDGYGEFMAKFGGIDVRDVAEDNLGNLWLAVFGSGVVRYDTGSGEVKRFEKSSGKGGLSSQYVYDIECDRQGNIWVSTASGLNKMSSGDSVFVSYLATSESGGLPDNTLRFSFSDEEGRIWFATDKGLSLYNSEKDNFTSFKNDIFGFPDMIIRSIEQDAKGNFWLSTSNGIIKVDFAFEGRYLPVIKEFFVYDVNHGILSDDFFSRSSAKDQKGRLYFGGTMGVDYFDPGEVTYSEQPPQVQIEEIRIFDQVVNPGSLHGPPVNDDGAVILSHKDNMISFEFAALNFVESQRNRYFYKLEPLHDEWHFAGFTRNLNFANLSPGEYTFRVRSCFSNTICDSGEASLIFQIRPPFWRTSLFLILVAIVFIVLMFMIQAAWTSGIRRKKLALENLVRRRTLQLSQKNHELTVNSNYLATANSQLSSLNSMKDRFFSIIAHDLRSPLSVLAGFSYIMMNDYEKYDDKKRKEIISIIYESVKNTVQLLDNLLQWANSQTNRLNPKREEVLPAVVADEVYLLHKELFVKKNIRFSNRITKDLKVITDNEIIRVILRNLFTNSVKFTPSDGEIIISASPLQNGHVRIDVTDTGRGIPESMKESLFRLDVSSTSPGTEGEKGTGLGLTLCNELINCMGGMIWVEETSEQGTTFSFTLTAHS